MEKVSILLTVRKHNLMNEVDIIGECEKGFHELALFSFSCQVIQRAKEHGGVMVPWTKEPELHKFCYSFRFETEEQKNAFVKHVMEFGD